MRVEELEQLVGQGTDAMTVKRVFGEPITKDGLTLIPVAKVRGAGGLGTGEGPNAQGKGAGAGFALTSRALGTFVIKGEDVRFVPAVDVNRVTLIGGAIAFAVIVFLGLIPRLRPR
jgi:uncharacterized spore protein YtfJ